jgi:uncharacterized protein (DUF1697 family)
VTAIAAFLRGVNLGNRKVLAADLRAAFADLGFHGAHTLLASGNVIFDAEAGPDLRARIEAGLADRFGFAVPVVLRTGDALKALVASDPFGGRAEGADLKLYVTMLADPVAAALPRPCEAPGDFRVVRATAAEIFHEAYRMPNGRYGLGAAVIGKTFEKLTVWTNRNWNTIVKAAALC